MNKKLNTKYINLDNVMAISKGSEEKVMSYLTQFTTLIPDRIERLQKEIASHNDQQIKRVLHNMSPQVQFFGLPKTIDAIKRVELEYDQLNFDEKKSIIFGIIGQLEDAVKEVNTILNKSK